MARISLWMAVALLAAHAAFGQTNQWQGTPATPAAAPQRQAAPQGAPNAAAPQPQAPFQLTPPEQAQLDRVLNLWQQASNSIKSFRCEFTRWQFTAANPKAAAAIDQGVLKYAAPDKGLFQIVGNQPEQWICDGKSMYQFDYMRQELVQHVLPPELQGQSIVNGPLPFMFGAQAVNLKARYWMRIVANQDPKSNEILLQAFPKLKQDATNFSRADILLNLDPKTQLLQPKAVQTFDPRGESRTAYEFKNPVVNPNGLIDILKGEGGDPFKPSVPANWRLVVKNPEAGPPPQNTQAARPNPAPANPR